MASPVAGSAATSNNSTASDPIGFNLPNLTATAGNLLFGYVRIPAATTFAAGEPAGWTRLVDGASPDAADDLNYIFYKISDGTEGGGVGQIQIDMTSSAKAAGLCWEITGNDSGAPQVSSATTGTGANINPANFTPSGGPKDFLYIAVSGLDGETQTYTAPSGYSGLGSSNSGTGGAAASNCVIAGANKETSGSSSEDAGAWTHAAPSSGVTAYMIAVAPPAATAKSLLWPQPGISTVYLR